MIEVEKIAEVLGLVKPVHSLFDLSDAVAKGLPKRSLKNTVQHLSADRATIRDISNQLIPPATYKRRKGALSPQESERVERIARVYATALDVWDSEDDAREFLFKGHPMLKGKRPVDAAFSELGARQVEHILAKIKYGLAV